MNAFEGARCVGKHDLFDSTDPFDHLEARALCETCPVILACQKQLADLQRNALHRAGPEGTWAGRLVGERERKRARCGSSGGYRRHQRNGEKPCEECRLWRNADARARAEKAARSAAAKRERRSA